MVCRKILFFGYFRRRFNENMEKDKSDQPEEVVDERPFDFEKFCTNMKKSITGSLCATADVELESYLTAYEQLQNFFVLLGAAFQFVAIDVRSKIKILQSYQRKENEEEKSKNFQTVNKMVWYEMDNNLLSASKYVSGSRTLLRLHRGLNFVRKFLAEVYRLENDVKLGGVARDVYNQTLAEHHGWVIRNGARAAMQFLPTRIELLKKISESDEERLSHILQLFPDAIQAMNMVYDRVQNIYTLHNLLDLP